MDEQKLKDLLSQLQAPEPKESVKNQVLESAMAAFSKKMEKTSQGKSAKGRLTDMENAINNVRRFIMQKKYVWSGIAGGVSVMALAAVLGPSFFEQQMQVMIPKAIVATGDTAESAAIAQKVMNKNAAPMPAAPALAPAEDMVAETMMPMGAAVAEQELMPMRSKSSTSFQAERMLPSVASPSYISSDMMIGDMPPQYYQDEGRDKFKTFQENTVKTVAADPVSTFSIDVDTSSYSFMRRHLNGGSLPPKDAVRIEEMVNYFDYNYALPEKGTDPFKPTIAVYDSPWAAGHKMIHIGIKGYDVETKPKSNLVFLIDTSGSMNSPDKLPLLKNSFKMMLDTLSPDDTVSIAVYAGAAGTALEPTKVSEKQKIIQAIDSLQSGGSTAGAAGINLAYLLAEKAKIKDGNNRIILATDGDFNVGISSPDELKSFVEKKRAEGIFLSVLGFGSGNYNDHLMQELAQNGNGNAAYIDTLSEARKVLVEEASSTLFTIAKDVKIQVEFNPAVVSEYRLVGYETRHLNREDFNNDKVDAGEIGSGHAVTAIYEVTPVGGVKMVDDLRYGDVSEKAVVKSDSKEYAFLKIRYKEPNADVSKLITRPITPTDDIAFDKASDDVRFAAAVAGFGQLLKGSVHSGSLTYDQVIEVANNARGQDSFGYRSEFVNLVRLAKSAPSLLPQQ